jgi:hypothetical protein
MLGKILGNFGNFGAFGTFREISGKKKKLKNPDI